MLEYPSKTELCSTKCFHNAKNYVLFIWILFYQNRINWTVNLLTKQKSAKIQETVIYYIPEPEPNLMFSGIHCITSVDNVTSNLNMGLGINIIAWIEVMWDGWKYYWHCMNGSHITWIEVLLHGLKYYYMNWSIITWIEVLLHGLKCC